MSYEILYGKQFVKLRRTREIIPMVLMGSNNCFECPSYGHSRGRRDRNWSDAPWYNRKSKRFSEKPEVIVKNLDAELNRHIRKRFDKEDKPADIRNHWGYYASVAISGQGTRGTSWNAWRSQFTNGIKNALSIEELDKLGIHLYFYTFTMHDEPTNGIPQSVDITTEPQYFAEMAKWRGWQNGNGKSFGLSFHPHDTDQVLRRLRESKRRPPREKATVEQDHFFVLTDGFNGLVKYTRNGYRYSYNKDCGKRFQTEKDAERYRQSLVKANRYKADIWKVERIEAHATFRI
jgi:hypothetical protein